MLFLVFSSGFPLNVKEEEGVDEEDLIEGVADDNR